MLLSQIKQRDLLWWKYGDDKRLLVRVILISNVFVAVRVIAATPQEVIDSGYGVGETLNTSAEALFPVAEGG